MVRQSVLLHESAAAACSCSSSEAAFGIIAAAVASDRFKRIRRCFKYDLSWPIAAFCDAFCGCVDAKPVLSRCKTCFEHC